MLHNNQKELNQNFFNLVFQLLIWGPPQTVVVVAKQLQWDTPTSAPFLSSTPLLFLTPLHFEWARSLKVKLTVACTMLNLHTICCQFVRRFPFFCVRFRYGGWHWVLLSLSLSLTQSYWVGTDRHLQAMKQKSRSSSRTRFSQ